MQGVGEDPVAFTSATALSGAGRFRRFGSEGPLYEVVEIQGDRSVIRVVESGETAIYPLASALADPVA